jgi:YVTN family beta-propeller protein
MLAILTMLFWRLPFSDRSARCVRRIMAAALLLPCLLDGRARAAGGGPSAFADAVAVNPVTNKVYIADTGTGTVTVLDGVTGATSTINTGGTPNAIAVNPVTNKIYVTNTANHGVAVIDGATNAFITIAVPAGDVSSAVAVNPATNKIYVVNTNSNGNVMVIDGATNNTVIVTDPNANDPVAVAVNPVTNKIYVANRASNNLTVIDGATNATTTVAAGNGPIAVAVNPQSYRIYVSDFNGVTLHGAVAVIDGVDNAVLGSPIPVGVGPFGLAVNPVTNKIYVANAGGSTVRSTVTIIDGDSNEMTEVPAGLLPMAVAVNPVNNKIYVANHGDSTVTVIDGASNTTTTVAGGENPNAVAVNPMTGKVYVADTGTPDVTVIGGATIQTATIGVTTSNLNPQRVVVNPVTNQIYMTDSNNTDNNSEVAVIDGASGGITPLPAGTGYGPLDVNQVTNMVYALNTSGGVTVIAGATSTQPATVVSTIQPANSPLDVAVNPATNRLYISMAGGTVAVLDGTTSNVITTIPVGADPDLLAVNPATNKIYVLSNSPPPQPPQPPPSGPNEVTIIDGTSNTVIAVLPMAAPESVVVNPVTNRIYVTDFGGNVTVIDGDSNAIVATIPIPYSIFEAVNPVSNRLYVTNASSNSGHGFQPTAVIDGASNTVVATVPAGASSAANIGIMAVAVNPITNHVYIAAFGSNVDNPVPATVSVIDGISDTISTIPVGVFPQAMAVNPVTNRNYVASAFDGPNSTSFVTAIAEQQVQPVPLTVAIAFAGQHNGESTVDRNPVFQFSVTSNFQPFNLPVRDVYYQLDTWQGAWLQATGAGTNFTAQLSSLTLGNHVLYAYATDGQDATLSPGNALIGPIAAFPFTVVQPLSQVSLGPQSLNGSPTPYNSTVSVVGRGFQPGDTLQIVFTNLPDQVPDLEACTVCGALYSHLDQVPAPTLARVGPDGTFQVAEVVAHNIENGFGGPVTILVESTDSTPGMVKAIGAADTSYWIGPMPTDF